MRVYATIEDVHMPLGEVPAHAQRAEALGYDGLIVPEAVQDAILISLLALEHTERIRVATGVVVAFARSPMLLAQDAWSLAQLSGGRFDLGLGSQVRGNVVGRFGMPWSAPVARMRDYVGALRAIFSCWQEGTELEYQSESYTLTRMQPFFRPEPLENGEIPIVLGAVGPAMTRLAGEVATAVLTHPTNASPDYLRDVTRARLRAGTDAAGRSDAPLLVANPMTATGPTPEAVAREREQAREVLGFTFSTPAYRATLDHHGWGHVHETLREKTRAGDWAGMRGVLTGEMLDVLVPTAPFDRIASLLRERYGGVADGITLRMPADPAHDPGFAEVITALRAD